MFYTLHSTDVLWFLFIAYLPFAISNFHQVFFTCFTLISSIMVLSLNSIQIFIIFLAEACHNSVNQSRYSGIETKLCDAVSCYYCYWPWIIPEKSLSTWNFQFYLKCHCWQCSDQQDYGITCFSIAQVCISNHSVH